MKRNSSRWWNPILSTSLSVFALLGLGSQADARLIQILQTNDLHSFMESSETPGRGGYAAVKATLEQAKQEASSQGIESIVLDAGDFSDGTPLFFADDGKQSWRVIDAMGYDAIAVGNHDFLVGPAQMDRIAADIRPRTPFLAANMKFDENFRSIRKAVRPYHEFKRAGLNIAVLGLTTDELVYRWRMKSGGGIGDPIESANRHLAQLRSRNDLVILLTHLGTDQDVKVISKTKGSDIVIGGHSHTTLNAPVFSKDLSGKRIPITQTGSHGEWIGKILVDVEPGEEMKLVHYELIPVYTASGERPEADTIRSMVADTRRLLEKRYGAEWLYSTVGFSNSPMERPKDRSTAWGNFFMETVRQSAKADLSLDPGEFHGESQPSGAITPEKLMNSYPRVFDIKNRMGWTVWKIRVPGWMIQFLVDQVVKQGLHLNSAGLTFEVESSPTGAKAKNLKINGRSVNVFKNYTLAVTEGIGRGALEISFILQTVFNPRDTGIPVWTALEKRIQAMGGDFMGRHGTSTLGMIQ